VLKSWCGQEGTPTNLDGNQREREVDTRQDSKFSLRGISDLGVRKRMVATGVLEMLRQCVVRWHSTEEHESDIFGFTC
jgi:hypothetical protein